ncbi:SWIM zinc finger family protein [Roseateles chitinivorans]|uniref:SWIM zinc finger family protein n=1 Tax=Roseateles chitinivorans TaxID=2917965 RepID=UPI003D671562
MTLTMEGVLALAPDEASAKAARGLTSPAKWPLLGADDAAVWGECQGSGAKPYQTQVDLSGPAFRCSCPSRKFPCKHGLALLMLRAQDASRFAAAEPPAWVSEWIASRGERAQKKEERDQKAVERATERAAQIADGVDPALAASALADPDNALKRESQRWRRIEDAAAELQRWLGDQIGRGLGALDDAAIRGWRTMAARMVDAQAPGLGQRISAAADGWRLGADWPERMLSRLGLLQLACEGIARRETLPAPVQADLRTVCGWPLDQAEVLAVGERVTDRWTVLGVIVEEREGRLNERRVWLHGARSGRRAWLLDHAHGGRGFEGLWLPGLAADLTLAFYPGNAPLRALIADASPPPEPEGAVSTVRLAGSDSWQDEWQRVAERVATHPFVQLHPVVLANATPVAAEVGPHLSASGRAVPLLVGDADWWSLMAVAGAHPLAVMGEWDGRALRPLTAWQSGMTAPAWSRSAA